MILADYVKHLLSLPQDLEVVRETDEASFYSVQTGPTVKRVAVDEHGNMFDTEHAEWLAEHARKEGVEDAFLQKDVIVL